MWSVEYANSDDAPEILRVQKGAFAENQKRYRVPLPPLQETLQDVQNAIERGMVLVARQNDGVIGAVRLEIRGEEAEVSHLAVDPAYSQLAVGRSLMTRCEDEAKADGAQKIVLETGLLDAPAIEFYVKLRYRPFSLKANAATEYDVVRFQKPLA